MTHERVEKALIKCINHLNDPNGSTVTEIRECIIELYKHEFLSCFIERWIKESEKENIFLYRLKRSKIMILT